MNRELNRLVKKLGRTGMIVLLAIVFAAGCTSKNTTNNENSPKPAPDTSKQPAATNETKEPLVFSYWLGLNGNAAATMKNLSEVEMYKELEKQTGAKVTFKHPPVGQDSEQFNMIIASREFSDVMEYRWDQYPGGPAKAIEDGVIIRLNELIDQHAPNLKKIMEDNPDLKRQLMTADGDLYVFPSINLGKYRVASGIYIRQDWLEDLNLDVPVTIEDWENVLRAFKEKKEATSPFTFAIGGIGVFPMFVEAYGVRAVNNPIYAEDGAVKYGPYEPAFKDAVTIMNKWHKEGLIDKDFATNDDKIMNAKIVNGEAGAFMAYIGSGMGKYITLMKDVDPKFKLVAAPYPVLNKGDRPKFAEISKDFDGLGAAITTSSKNAAEIVKWFDIFYSEEGRMLKNFGIEGLTYNLEDGFPKYSDLIMKNPDGLPVAQAMAKYMRANYASPGMADDRYLEQFYEYPEQKEALKTFSEHLDYAKTFLLPPSTFTQSESDEASNLRSEIDTYQKEMFIKFVVGQEPLSNYDQFVKRLKDMKVERFIELYQISYDRFYSN